MKLDAISRLLRVSILALIDTRVSCPGKGESKQDIAAGVSQSAAPVTVSAD